MRDEKGITLIALITTIIVMLIITGVAAYTGIDTYNNLKVQAFLTKMIALQEKVDTLCEKYTVTEMNTLGIRYESADDEAKAVLDSVIEKGNSGLLNSWFDVDNIPDNYRYFTISDIEADIGLKDFDVTVWINPVTRNIVAVKGVEDEGVKYYRQYDLDGGQTLPPPIIQTSTVLSEAEYRLQTYDNRAFLKFTNEDGTSRQYSKVTYTLKFEDSSKNVSKTFANVSEIEFPYSGIYDIFVTNTVDEEKTLIGVDVTKVNKPLLVEGMTPIKYNSTTKDWVETTSSDPEWYNYGLKNWANVKLLDGSMYVWIPRFAYKTNETLGMVDIKFLNSYSNVGTDGTALTASYRVAPAFQSGVANGYANGEWDEQITGFWVAKYEFSKDPDSNILKSVPVKEAALKYTPHNAFVACRKLEASGNATNYFNLESEGINLIGNDEPARMTGEFEEDENNIDTHLVKNSEWGAIAYLTYSKYGNMDIEAQDSIYPGYTASELAGGSYSTSGNETGIFGIAGGEEEQTASGIILEGIYNIEDKCTKYATFYSDMEIYGDGIQSIERTALRVELSEETYPSESAPIFLRGGGGSRGNIFQYKSIRSDEEKAFRAVIITNY